MKDNALYLEADEDITSAIDKLQKVEGDAVQIVVPKRSTMLQSIINLKLLKKAAASSGKELVLVTNDRVATDLAGRLGLAVAPSLGAKPVIAETAAPEPVSNEDVIEADDPEPTPPTEAPAAVASKPTAPKKPLFARKAVDDKPTPPATPASVAAAAVDAAEEPSSVDSIAKSGPKVPNFNKLQKRLLWVGLAVVLIVGYFVAMYFLTSAKVTLYAVGSKVGIDMTFAADPNLHQTDQSSSVLAAQTVTFSKDLSAPFTPTGQKDVGTQATGQMTIYNTYDTNTHELTSGTRLSAPDGKIFRTNSDVTVPGATPTLSHGQLSLQPGTVTVAVTADQNGDTYNEGPARYTIVAYSGDMQSKIYGQGAQMGGGTSKTVTVVTQDDINKAQTALLAGDKAGSQRNLDSKVPSGYQALTSSQAQTADNVTSSPTIGAEGTTATLSLKATYTELAVKKTDYTALVEAAEQKQIGSQNQVYDNGLNNAQVTASPADSSGRQSFHLTTQAYGGAKLDKVQIATQLKGKRYGDAAEAATKLPGVQKVDISLWPVWVTSLPARASQISISIQVASQ